MRHKARLRSVEARLRQKRSAEAPLIRFASQADLLLRFPPFDRWPSRDIRRKIEQKEIIVAEVKGKIVGYLHLQYLWGQVPFLALIRVKRRYRGQKLSRKMLFFLEDSLRRRGFAFLLSSSQENETAPQSWHRHMGFVPCGTLEGINQDGMGEVFFKRSL